LFMWRGSVRAGNVRKGKGCTGNVGKRERNHFIYTELSPTTCFGCLTTWLLLVLFSLVLFRTERSRPETAHRGRAT
jgi:hypothetical protein